MHNLTNEFQYQRKSNFLLKPAFYFFIFTCIAIPSGSFFGTPLRTVASTFLIFTFLADLIIGNQINLKHLSIGALFIATLLSYSLLGMLNGYPAYSVRGQAMDVLATFLPAYLGSYLWLKERRADTLITAFLFSGIAHALTKITFFSLLFLDIFR